MVTVKTDNLKRVILADQKPGQIFSYTCNVDGSVILKPIKKAATERSKVKFIKKNGYTVGHTGKKVSLETIKEILSDFP